MVTLGKVISVMGSTSREVEIGLSSQSWKDFRMRQVEPSNPAATTRVQNNLSSILESEICDSPCTVEDLRGSINLTIFKEQRRSKR